MKRFDGIVSKDLSNVYKVITTDLPPTKFSPYKEPQEAIKQNLVLIGGDGSYDYGENDWYRLAFEFKTSTLHSLTQGVRQSLPVKILKIMQGQINHF